MEHRPSYRALTLHLPESLLSAAEAMAHGQSITVAQLLRQALAGQVGLAVPSDPAPSHRMLSLRARLTGDFVAAQGWGDLHARLRAKGYALEQTSADWQIVALPDRAPLCAAAELGFGPGVLGSKFGTVPPPHPPGWRANRIARGDPPEDEDFDVIDRSDTSTAQRPSA